MEPITQNVSCQPPDWARPISGQQTAAAGDIQLPFPQHLPLSAPQRLWAASMAQSWELGNLPGLDILMENKVLP